MYTSKSIYYGTVIISINDGIDCVKIIRREENRIADGLARWAYYISNSSIYSNVSELSLVVNKLIYFEIFIE